MKSRNYVGTFWLHMSDTCLEERFQALIDNDVWRFCAYGEEVCPTTGVLHYQVYFSYPNPRSVDKVRHDFYGHHIEVMRGSFKENEDYCSKEGRFTKLGEEPRQGNRTDLEYVCEMVREGAKPMDLVVECPNTIAQYERFFSKYEQHCKYERLKANVDVPEVYVCIGPAGTGKTRWCREQVNHDLDEITIGSGRFFCGYRGSDNVLINEMGPGIMPLDLFKKITDRYTTWVEIKGGEMVWHPKKIFMTSNYKVSTWWNLDGVQWHAIKRRITEKKIFLLQEETPETDLET